MRNDHITRYISKDGFHQLYLLQATGVMEEIAAIRPLSEVSFRLLSSMVTLALLRSNNLKGASEMLTFQLDTTSDAKKAIATANAKGEVKGYIQNPDAQEEIGASIISCTADLGLKAPYHSSVIATGDTLEEKINCFFEQSDQTTLRYALCLSPKGEVRALLYHELPGDEPSACLWDEEKAHQSLSDEHEDFLSMAKAFYGEKDFEEVSDEPVVFRCDCSRKRFLGLLETLSDADLQDLIAKKEDAVTTCGWCGKTYSFPITELSDILGRRS